MTTLRIQWARYATAVCAITGLLTLESCQDHRSNPDPQQLPDRIFYALTDGNQLLKLNVRNPASPEASMPITDLASGDKLLAIDFRPATGQLYGIGSSSRVYVIDPKTAKARAIGGSFVPPLDGDIAGFDFNPTVDRIRLVTNKGQNLRLNPETGAVANQDGAINGAPGAAVAAVAYTNNKAGAATTTLYDIDPATDKLYKQDPPNGGGLVEVGSLGLDISAAAGFDIAPDGDQALAAVTVGGKSELNTVNLGTGRLSKLGDFPGGVSIIGLAIPTAMVAYAVDGSNNLLVFDPLNPQPVSKPISPLQGGETILGIDFRPANGQLYALGSSGRLYTINTSSGAAVVVNAVPFTTPLAGTKFGFDFNPTVDRIRVVSNTGQNLRLVPDNGAVAMVDGALKPGTPAVTAAAYTNSFAGATSTTLFVIDSGNDRLYVQNPPNDGVLVERGGLGIDVSTDDGFDIGGSSNQAWVLASIGGTTNLYSIDLNNGLTAKGAALPTMTVRGFAVGLGF